MSATSLTTAARYAGRWSAIVFFVVLLTLIFSFLGTIICAVLAGMMFGATRHVRWQAALISLIFPGAIFGLLRAGRAPLLEHQIVVLSLLCFGAFWMAYGMAATLVYFERSGPVAAATPTASATTATGVVVGNVTPLPPLTMNDLQGRWSAAPFGSNGHTRAKELEIKAQELVLCVRDGEGRVSTLGRAEVRFEAGRRVTLSPVSVFEDDTLVSI